MEELGEPTLMQTLRSHRSEVTCVDASGARLATGGGDRALRLWRWASGTGWDEAARAEHAHRYGVTAARWSPSGVLLASAGVDGAARVWCGRSLAPRRLLAAPGAAAARALCWAGRGRLLAGHDDGVLCVWHVPRAQLVARLHAHEGALHAVAAPACGALLLTACTHGVLKVFDLAEVCESGIAEMSAPAPLTWVDGAHDLGALCADASADGRLAATGGHDALVRVWRARGGGGGGGGTRGLQPLGSALEGHAAAVTGVRWAADAAGAVLASASLDRTARLWVPDGAGLRCLHVVHAHPRYLTCVALACDLRYIITGSNDKSLRMWSLGSLTLDDELEVPCAALTHYALGDLQGIGPVDNYDDELKESGGVPAAADDVGVGEEVEGGGGGGGGGGGVGARRVWHAAAHAGAINYIATHNELVATASSDGLVRVYRWSAADGGGGALHAEHALQAHQYPATAADFGAAGALLLTAGLDGRGCLWDVQSGVQLRSVCAAVAEGAAGAGGAGGAGGGGGARAARLAPRRPPLLLLATDDALAPCWSLANTDPKPIHVFAGHVEAVTCCAWSGDARVLAAAGSGGELRVHAAPPDARALHHEPRAHDLGVQSCDFAPPAELELPDETYLLATAGSDSLIKLWLIQYKQAEAASVRVVVSVAAHGGGAVCVRWRGALLASAGADRWARVWRVAPGGAAVRLMAAVAAPGAGGVLAVALLAAPPLPDEPPAGPPLLLCGSMAGELSVWQLPPDSDDVEDSRHDEEGTVPCFWSQEGVERWLREYVTRSPGSRMSCDEEAELIQRSQDANITGWRLVSDPVEELLANLGYDAELENEEIADSESKSSGERAAVRERLRDELCWLRRPPPPPAAERCAPHALLCPLTHALVREPARAADGYTYERANILDWFLAAGGAVSPVSGRYLRNAHVMPNYALRDQLRLYLLQRDN